MKAIRMDTREPEQRSRTIVWVTIAAVGLFCVVVAFTIPKLVAKVRSATALNPGNFGNANTEFFEGLSNREIAIISSSSTQQAEIKQGQFKIAIVPLQKDSSRIADQENKKAHANGTVLVFACYELLNGDKELGRKLLELLKQHDSKIRYNYPTGKKGLLSDPGTNIYIVEFVQAADKFIKSDSSDKGVLERPASQYEWRRKQYGPKTTSE